MNEVILWVRLNKQRGLELSLPTGGEKKIPARVSLHARHKRNQRRCDLRREEINTRINHVALFTIHYKCEVPQTGEVCEHERLSLGLLVFSLVLFESACGSECEGIKT